MAIKVKKGKGILFEAVPDIGKIGVRVGENGRPLLAWPNRIAVPDDLLTKLRKDTVPFLYPPPKPIEYRGASWILNTCADADEYRNALIGLDQAFGKKLPIFNHPRAVAMTRRDLSAKLLTGISNLIVPKCVRFKADTNNSFQKTFEREDFSYPVLVRPATSQTGQDLVKIDTPFDWVKVYQTHWYGKYHYMTQFIDTQTESGFLKARVVLFGGSVHFHHVKKSNNWLIHHGGDEVSPEEFFEEEQYIVDKLKSCNSFAKMMSDIYTRSKMDLLGVDISIGTKNFVLFEANAAMTIFHDKAYYSTNIMKKRYENMHGPLADGLTSYISRFTQGKLDLSDRAAGFEAFHELLDF